MDIFKVLGARFSDCSWGITGNSYEDLQWFDEKPKPTKEELESLWPTVKEELERKKVERKRQVLYESMVDPLFFQYQAGEVTKEEWLNARQLVKDQNPYPEGMVES